MAYILLNWNMIYFFPVFQLMLYICMVGDKYFLAALNKATCLSSHDSCVTITMLLFVSLLVEID